MRVKGFDKETTKRLEVWSDGHFEEMLRTCHPFNDEEDIKIRDINGVSTTVDAVGDFVAIGMYSGDDTFDDCVYVYNGVITDYIHRDDYGNYRMCQDELIENDVESFNAALKFLKEEKKNKAKGLFFHPRKSGFRERQ